MVLHGSRVSADLKPFHENLEKRFKEMKVKTAPFKKVSTGEKKDLLHVFLQFLSQISHPAMLKMTEELTQRLKQVRTNAILIYDPCGPARAFIVNRQTKIPVQYEGCTPWHVNWV